MEADALVYYETEPDVPADEPVSVEGLYELLRNGEVTYETQVWHDGMEGWSDLQECDDILAEEPFASADHGGEGEGGEEEEGEAAEADDDAGEGLDAADLWWAKLTPEEKERQSRETARESFAEEFLGSLSPTKVDLGLSPAARRRSSGRYSPGTLSARSTVLRSPGGQSAVASSHLLDRMEKRMAKVEENLARGERAAREAAGLKRQLELQERKLKDYDRELLDLRNELGHTVPRVTNRVLASIDLESLEQRIVRADEEHDEKLKRMQAAVDSALRGAEVSFAQSGAKQRERWESELQEVREEFEQTFRVQGATVASSLQTTKEKLELLESIPAELRAAQEQVAESTEARCTAIETEIRERMDTKVEPVVLRCNQGMELLKMKVSLAVDEWTHGLERLRKDLDEGLTEMEGKVETTMADTQFLVKETMAACETNHLLAEMGVVGMVEAADASVKELNERVDASLAASESAAADERKSVQEQIAAIERAAHAAKIEASAALTSECAELQAAHEQLALAAATKTEVAEVKETLRQETSQVEEHARTELAAAVSRQHKDSTATNADVELLKTKVSLALQEWRDGLRELTNAMKHGLEDMEDKVDATKADSQFLVGEMVQKCEMNHLLAEMGAVSMVQAADETVKRLGERVGVVEVQAKESAHTLKHVCERDVASLERGAAATKALVERLSTKLSLASMEWSDGLTSLTDSMRTSLEGMEDRVDAVCDNAEMETLLAGMTTLTTFDALIHKQEQEEKEAEAKREHAAQRRKETAQEARRLHMEGQQRKRAAEAAQEAEQARAFAEEEAELHAESERAAAEAQAQADEAEGERAAAEREAAHAAERAAQEEKDAAAVALAEAEKAEEERREAHRRSLRGGGAVEAGEGLPDRASAATLSVEP